MSIILLLAYIYIYIIYIYICIYIYHVRVVWLWKYWLISNLVIITILLINWFLKKVVFVPNIAWCFVLWFRVSVKGNGHLYKFNSIHLCYILTYEYTIMVEANLFRMSNGILPGSWVGKWWSCLILFTLLLCVKVEHSFSKETDCTLSN